ncbi:ras-related protein Rab-7L1-like [Liolophura sinensis]|uniref:ras-related protein Rab-7L1-like n=1 Tax=Liolophura sinensis TaxID=3198878 RepID=UPI00315927F1
MNVVNGAIASSPPEGRELAFKIILIGEPSVGKTAFVHRYVNDSFPRHYKVTVGVDYALRVVRRPGHQRIKLQLWDIAGQERFTPLTRVYYKGTHGCIIMFDLTKRSTYLRCIQWKNDLDAKCSLPDGSPIPCLLIGNKCDLSDKQVTDLELETMCQENSFIGWTETSVKESVMVEESMEFLTDAMLAKDRIFNASSEANPLEDLDSSIVNLPRGSRQITRKSSCSC